MITVITKKRALGKLWSITRQNSGPRKCILLYHAVGESPWAISTDKFRIQIEWLAKHAVVLPLDKLLQSPSTDKLEVALTFDDGYACLADHVEPVLREFDLSATVYLNTGWIMEEHRRPSKPELGHYPDEFFLAWRDVAMLSNRGWIIGSHGVEHLDLTCTPTELTQQELSDSRTAIEAHLGTDCQHFSYTWGRHSPSLRTLVLAAGYKCAAAAHHAPLKPTDDRHALPRINVDCSYQLEDLKAILRGDWDYLGWLQRLRALKQ